MIEKKEKNYLTILLGVDILLLFFAVFSLIYLFVIVGKEGNINKNVLELFYLGVHIVILTMAIYLLKEAFKRGSNIMRSLMFNKQGARSIPARCVSIFFIVIGIVSFVYGLLILLPTGVYDFNFPIALKWDLLNVGLTLFLFAIFFLLFPFLFESEVKKTNK